MIKEDQEVYLTKRQYEILKLLKKGMNNGEIAGELQISENTVKFHTKKVYAKLGVYSRAKLLANIIDTAK